METPKHELKEEARAPVPSRSAIHRRLLRQGLITHEPRKRKRADYRRWERSRSMELWQIDIMGGVYVTDGTTSKLSTPAADSRPAQPFRRSGHLQTGASIKALTTAHRMRSTGYTTNASHSCMTRGPLTHGSGSAVQADQVTYLPDDTRMSGGRSATSCRPADCCTTLRDLTRQRRGGSLKENEQ